ncbi:MAG: Bax inhibitor-1/YccA family protein [Bacteroidales bacterium]|jgi:FtsH-binding integral membrane protein|nr:Bax inhibitor-1/YccA family protein [Bacteroidales bacterium]
MNYSEDDNISIRQANVQDASIQRSFMSKAFLWMTGALALTAITAFLIASNPQILAYLFDLETGSLNVLGWVVIFAPFVLVLIMSSAVNRLSLPALSGLYILYSILMGASLSFIFLAYDIAHIGITFAVTAGTFGVMALVGFTTKTDLTKFGSILLMGLIGIIIAMLVNLFLRSGTMDYVISIIGVLIFTGLTAYDVQKLKKFSGQIGEFNETVGKMALMGALTLYLDFINLFLFLLRIFGRRN